MNDSTQNPLGMPTMMRTKTNKEDTIEFYADMCKECYKKLYLKGDEVFKLTIFGHTTTLCRMCYDLYAPKLKIIKRDWIGYFFSSK